MFYKAKDGEVYTLHLIDTPGHVDFSYEVSRALAACEGALLLVDATQGIEAQTVANFWKAVEQDLVSIPVINKIDLPAADPERVKRQIEEILGIPSEEVILASAKEGIGIEEILEAIVKRIPPPKGDPTKPLKALIFDSYYDQYRGAVAFVRVFDGEVRPGMRIRLFSTGKEFEVTEVGAQTPKLTKFEKLSAGDVGYIAASIKDVRDIRVGDTITDAKNPTPEPVPGFRPAKPMVYAGIYPSEGYTYEELREALEKYAINDAAIQFEPETSPALGLGFRVGFLGLLHMEIVQERLEREYGVSIVTTAPSVVYRVRFKNGQIKEIRNPSELPENWGIIEAIEEPFVLLTIITPKDYVGNIMNLCQEKRGIQKKFTYLDQNTVMLEYEMPLSEIILDFHDKVKSYDTERALKDIEPLSKEKSLLMVAQNGYGNYEKAIRLFGKGKVILSRVIFGAKLLEWGHVRITVCGDDVVIGDPSGIMEEGFLKDLAKLFSKAGIPTRYERDVYKYLWDKILYNCALNPLGALFERSYGELAKNPYTKELMDRMIEEAFEALRANSIETFWKGPEDYKRHFYERLIPPTADHYPSMLEDVKRGKTEIDALNGALVELAKEKGLKVPTNEMIVKLIRAKERFNLP